MTTARSDAACGDALALLAGYHPDMPVHSASPPGSGMWHLSTLVTARVPDPAISSLTLGAALHPTPAVCGTPTRDARAAIAEYETFDRGFYTGVVGWENAAGDGEWVVALRCAVPRDHTARLYAGAVIVADSDPAAELAETTAKFRTMLAGLGLWT